MDLRNWEFYTDNGQPLVGAAVNIRDAVLSHPNTGTVVASTTTDSNGMWAVTGLTNTPKDVEVIWGNLSQYHKWYKGMTRHSVATIEFSETQSNPIIPAVRAVSSSSQSIPYGTWTALALQTEGYDFGNMHDNVTNNSRLTAPVAGVYTINGWLLWDGSVTTNGLRGIALYINGVQATTTYQNAAAPLGANGVAQIVADQFSLAAGDYAQLFGYCDNSGVVAVTVLGSHLAAALIRTGP